MYPDLPVGRHLARAFALFLSKGYCHPPSDDALSRNKGVRESE
jgi:hypothetical protein